MKVLFGFCFFSILCCICFAELGYFWHFSDTHMQSDYKPGSSVDDGCTKGKGNAGEFGDYNCRSPFQVEHTAMETMPQLVPPECNGKPPAFVLWTGDSGARRFGKFSREGIEWEFANLTHELLDLQKRLGGVPIYPTIGNHDSFPQHQFKANNSWEYRSLASYWKPFLPGSALATLRTNGYYSVDVSSELKLIVLNTVIYYKRNKLVSLNETDPGNQIAWMRGQLETAKRNNQVVYIAGHIPPGYSSEPFKEPFLIRFLDGLKGYHNIIRGSFWGHLHTDGFQLIGDTSFGSTDYHVAHLASTLGSRTKKNPSFRRYIFDSSDSYNIQDWTTFYMDLPAANKAGNITWKPLYSAKQTYSIKDASPKSMFNLAYRMSFAPSLLKKYHSLKRAGAPIGKCGDNCKKVTTCTILYSYPDKYKKCMA